VLKREKAVFEVNPTSQPDLNTYKYIVQRQLKPSARKDMIELLASLEVKPTAMSAMSDGLASELAQISKKSKLGFAIYEDKMPIAPETLTVCEEFQLNPMTVVLNGGEDYELLFTISQNDYAKIKGNPHLTVIGHMTKEAEGTFLISKANQKIDLANNSFHEGA
jgi:thiamine-monophosphate kinase